MAQIKQMKAVAQPVVKPVDLPETADAGLVSMVTQAFAVASSHRGTVTTRMRENVMQANSEYECDTKVAMEAAGEPDIFFPLTALKRRAQYAWLRDTVANAMDKMWTITPTPIPALPTDSLELVRSQINDALRATINVETLPFDEVERMVHEAVDAEFDRVMHAAETRMRRMSNRILDEWVEGGWLQAWTDIANDLGTYPIAVMKGPVYVHERKLMWSGSGKPTMKYVKKRTMYRVPPEAWYPLPDTTDDVNAGSGVIELAAMSKMELRQAMEIGGSYRKDSIQSVLDTHLQGFTLESSDDPAVRALLNRADATVSDAKTGAGVYSTIKFYGQVQQSVLEDANVQFKVKSGPDYDPFHEVEAWVIAHQCVYLTMNTNPLGMRPFSVIPRELVVGNPFGGQSLPDSINVPQRAVNALLRNMMVNMAFSAGPIGEVETNRIPAGKDVPSYIRPRRLYPVTSSIHGNKAYRFTEIQSNSGEYEQAIEFFLQQADLLSGIPRSVAGTASIKPGETLGQTSLFQGNASKGLAAVLSNIDHYGIEPMLRRYYIDLMMFDDDDTIKGDAQVRARGLAGLFEEENKRAQAVQAINIIAPLREALGDRLNDESFVKLVSPVLKSLGFDVTDILKQPAADGKVPGVSQALPPENPLPPAPNVSPSANPGTP